MWIDPEVVELAGISADELERFKHPSSYEDQRGTVPQPDVTATEGPHMTNYPEGVYARIMGTPDEVMLNSVPSDPPVSAPA